MNIDKEIINNILLDNIKAISIIISYIIGGVICYTYLDSIDGIEFFSAGSISLFTTLFFLSVVIFLFLLLLFSMPYINSFYLSEYIDENKLSIVDFRASLHKVSIRNIIVLPLIVFGVLWLISFYNTENINNDKEYLQIENITVQVVITIVLLIIYFLYINIGYCQQLFDNEKKHNSKTSMIIGYIFCSIFIPNTFLTVWFVFSTFFGIDSPKLFYETGIFIIYFFIIIVIYAIPMENNEIGEKEKIYKIIILGVLCFFLMGLCGYIFQTNFSYSLMKIIGKADKKDYPYVINNQNKYHLPKIDNNIYCGRVLWRDDSIVVFLPIYEKNKKNRFILNKTDFSPLQGVGRTTYCNSHIS